LETLTDNQIMLQVKAGELHRMALLFQRHQRPLYRFLLYHSRQPEASEDMAQTVFYRMLQYRHTFTGKGEWLTWMYHLARNVLKDHARQEGRRGAAVALDELADTYAAGDGQSLEQKQAQQRLYRAIDRLPDGQREVVVYYCLQELRHKEIAEILGIREDAVRARLSRGLQELKKQYQKFDE
jgi:RNA polymerase sigma factor (sigma-70 family)